MENKMNQENLLLRIEQLEKRICAMENAIWRAPTRSNNTLNEKMHIACYRAAKHIFEDEKKNFSAMAQKVCERTGMKLSTATLSIMGAYSLLAGELFKSAISKKAAAVFLKEIHQDYGAAGLKKALFALEKHIAYRREHSHNVDLLDILRKQYQAML